MKLTIISFLCALFLGAATANASSLWPAAVDYGSGEKYSYWFGNFNDSSFPWIYHYEHGWLYCVGGDGSSIWFYDLKLGWIWSGNSIYPYFFFPDKGWCYYYQGGTPGKRWFGQMSTGTYFSDKGKSYDPKRGAPGDITWKYRVNGGESFSYQVDTGGISLDAMLTLNDATVSYFSDDKLQSFTATGTLTGTVTGEKVNGAVAGDFNMTVDNQFDYEENGDKTYVGSSKVNMLTTATATVGVKTTNILITEKSDVFYYDLGMEWFLDRTDLYDQTIGYQYIPESVGGHVDTEVSVKVGVTPAYTTYGDFSFNSMELWEVVEKFPAFEVLGHTYNRVVEMRHHTVIPNPMGEPVEGDIFIWVAEGIGPVKMIGQYDVQGAALTLELVETSLLP